MAFDHSKFIARFVEEASVHCSKISEGLFRCAHTIKGSSRMMKMTGISELAHKMEDVLDAARSKKIALTSSVADVLFKGVDALVAMLEKIKAGDSTTPAPEDICKALSQVALAAPSAVPVQAVPVLAEVIAASTQPPILAVGPTSSVIPASVPPTLPTPAVPALPALPGVVAPVQPAAPAVTTPQAISPKGTSADYLRVNSNKLDDLVRLMGEIVSEQGRYRRQLWRLGDIERQLARHQASVAQQLSGDEATHQILIDAGTNLQMALRQMVRTMTDASLMRDHFVSGLQDTSLRMRMQPLSTVFDQRNNAANLVLQGEVERTAIAVVRILGGVVQPRPKFL